MFKKIFFSLIILGVLAFGGLSFYVSTIDWNQHKAQIAKQIEDLTGKRVVFEGDVNLSFFPRPYLTAKNIKIYNQTGTNTTVPLAVINEMVTDLSLQPLLKGNFEVDNMTLQDARIIVEFLPDGRLNWYSEVSESQKYNLNNVEVALNSVMLKNAKVEIVNTALDVDVTLESLNAEITAQTLYGPYRIDGNFVKDNNPAGFALNLGTLSESFGTTLNLVLTHPTTESYARFDGKMLSNNSEIEGNFTVESKRLAKFVNGLTNQEIIPTDFDYPFSGSVALKVNPQQIDLSSLVIKYGEQTMGAGNLLIPFYPSVENDRRLIEFSFEFTELDMKPIVGILMQQLKKTDEQKQPFQPEFDFDMAVNIRAVKAYYNDEDIRNFNLNLNLVNDIVTVQKLSGLLPGDTEVSVRGDIFENDKVLTYDFGLEGISQDFLKFLEFINLKPQTYAQSTYRGAQLSTHLSGNLKQIKIAPISFTLDNNTFNATVGLVRGARKHVFVNVQSEQINFDNYLPQFSEEEQKLILSEKIKLVLNRFAFLNDFDLHFEAGLNVGIYHKTPFENVKINLDSQNGNVTLNQFHIGEIAATAIDLNGKLSGLGTNPTVENMKYAFSTNKFGSFKSKFNVPTPQWPLFLNAQKIKADGILTGNTDMITISAVTRVDEPFLVSKYFGKLFNQNNQLNFKGKLELNTSFVKFINSLGLKYEPRDFSTGVFTFKGDVAGTASKWSAQNVQAFISANEYNGKFSVEMLNERPSVTADLSTNRFEFDRLIYNPSRQNQRINPRQDTIDAFLKRPVLENININYDIYKTFDLKGKFAAKVLNYQSEEFSNAVADVNIADGKIAVKDFKADYGRGIGEKAPITAEIEIDINNDPRIKGRTAVKGYPVLQFGGEKYRIENGTLSAKFDFEAPAHSQLAFLEGLNGKLSFDVENTVMKGWNLKAPESDLQNRDMSKGLNEFVRNSLENGETYFDLIGAEIEFAKGNYTITNTLFSNDYATIDVSGKGTLKAWDIDAAFQLTYEKLKDKLPPILYSWRGNLSNPILTVDVSGITDKYDSYWAEIARQKQEAEEARLKALNEAMAETQDIVTDLTYTAQQEILPLIEKYKPLSFNAEVKSVYNSNHMQLTDINNQLEAMAQKAQTDFTMDDVTEMKVRLETHEPALVEIKRQVQENIKKDIKLHSAEAYNNIINIYDNSRNKAENYQKTLNAYVQRLIKMGSLVVLDRDPRVLDFKNNIETSLRTLEDLRAKANETKDLILASNSIEDLELKNKIIEELLQRSETELENLNTELESLFTYAQDMVRKEEKNTKTPPSLTLKTSQEDIVEQLPSDVKTEEIKNNAEASDSEIQPVVLQSAPEEKIEMPVPQSAEPEKLVKPYSDENTGVVAYPSRAVLSGSVRKSVRRISSQTEKTVPKPTSEPLLRPLSPNGNIVSGNIKKK